MYFGSKSIICGSPLVAIERVAVGDRSNGAGQSAIRETTLFPADQGDQVRKRFLEQNRLNDATT
jgi:hypothetical protein